MVVAVVKDEVPRRQKGVGDDLIRRRRTVEDKIRLVRMEDFSCEILRFQRRPFVNQQIAEGHVSIADIGLKNMRSIKNHKDSVLPDAS